MNKVNFVTVMLDARTHYYDFFKIFRGKLFQLRILIPDKSLSMKIKYFWIHKLVLKSTFHFFSRSYWKMCYIKTKIQNKKKKKKDIQFKKWGEQIHRSNSRNEANIQQRSLDLNWNRSEGSCRCLFKWRKLIKCLM